jgi:hypothetical protein
LYSFRPLLSLKHSLYPAGKSTVLLLLDLSGLAYCFYFSHSDYSITRDNALTLHGKKRIAEDRQ